MNSEGLINVSQAVSHGNLRQVRNFRKEKMGVVLDVQGEELKVSVGRQTEVWPYKDCEEISLQ